MTHPDVVHRDPRGQRMARIEEPASEGAAAAGAGSGVGPAARVVGLVGALERLQRGAQGGVAVARPRRGLDGLLETCGRGVTLLPCGVGLRLAVGLRQTQLGAREVGLCERELVPACGASRLADKLVEILRWRARVSSAVGARRRAQSVRSQLGGGERLLGGGDGEAHLGDAPGAVGLALRRSQSDVGCERTHLDGVQLRRCIEHGQIEPAGLAGPWQLVGEDVLAVHRDVDEPVADRAAELVDAALLDRMARAGLRRVDDVRALLVGDLHLRGGPERAHVDDLLAAVHGVEREADRHPLLPAGDSESQAGLEVGGMILPRSQVRADGRHAILRDESVAMRPLARPDLPEVRARLLEGVREDEHRGLGRRACGRDCLLRLRLRRACNGLRQTSASFHERGARSRDRPLRLAQAILEDERSQRRKVSLRRQLHARDVQRSEREDSRHARRQRAGSVRTLGIAADVQVGGGV